MDTSQRDYSFGYIPCYTCIVKNICFQIHSSLPLKLQSIILYCRFTCITMYAKLFYCPMTTIKLESKSISKKKIISHIDEWLKINFKKKYSLFMILFPSFGKDNKKLGYSFVYLKIILKIIFFSQSLILSIITDFKISLKSWIDKENIKYLFCVTGFVTWGI